MLERPGNGHRAILVGLDLGEADHAESVAELKQLTSSAGVAAALSVQVASLLPSLAPPLPRALLLTAVYGSLFALNAFGAYVEFRPRTDWRFRVEADNIGSASLTDTRRKFAGSRASGIIDSIERRRLRTSPIFSFSARKSFGGAGD